MDKATKKSASLVGAGVAVGAALGVAATAFLAVRARRAEVEVERRESLHNGRDKICDARMQPSKTNPTPHRAPSGGHTDTDNPVLPDVAAGTSDDKLVIVLVGLPARGKTHIAQMIGRYLSFFHGVPVKHFNVGDYRRKVCGNFQPADFFSEANASAAKQRHLCRIAAVNDLKSFMREGMAGQVALLDATNTTKERRAWLMEQLRELRVKVIFIEPICNDEAMIDNNIRSVKLGTPDYAKMEPTRAIADFRKRIAHYEAIYEPLDFEGDEEELPGIKIIDCRRFVINKVRGYLPGRITQFVMSLHTSERTIYMTRHGQSEYNQLGKIGGNSGLSKEGDAYAQKLAAYAEKHICVDPETGKPVPARLWTSGMRRTIETGQYIRSEKLAIGGGEYQPWSGDDVDGRVQEWVQMRPKRWEVLDEIYAGICDGMTYEEIEEVYPAEFARRKKDKLAYRYPRGESYLDVIHRLDQVIHEMERHREPLLMIGHQGILRLIYAFYMGLPREEAPHVSIPLNHVIKLVPKPYGCDEQRIRLHTKLGVNTDGQDEPQPREADIKAENAPSH